MQAAPAPEDWEAPFEDTSITAWLGTDGLWHLTVDAPGYHPYIASACGADLAPGVEEGANWTAHLERVDCTPCSASPWLEVAAANDAADRAREQAREQVARIRRGYPR
jgi:hypothetical protein